jgi:HSP20 family molecular chaperone IbpA
MRISRDVSVQVDGTSNEITVLTEVPGVVDEELTLALVSNAGNMDLRVKVVDSRPQVVDGILRHRVRLQLLTAEAGTDDRSVHQ